MVTNHPSLNCLSRITKDNFNILYIRREAKAMFSPESIVAMVAFRSARRISSYLVSAKLYPLERFAGLRQCKKYRCEVCTNLTETDTFFSIVTGETFQIIYKRRNKAFLFERSFLVLT